MTRVSYPISGHQLLLALLGLMIALGGGVHVAPVRVLPPPGMVYIPAGVFIMGTNTGRADEGPAHTVYLPAFYIDRYEVTTAAYARFLNARGGLANCEGFRCAEVRPDVPQSPLESSGYGIRPVPGYERHPVTWVSWYGARAFCRFYGKRLPTEAEWEKAARGTDGRVFPWGNVYRSRRANVGQVWNGTTPVGAFPLGLSPYGALDMAGNVWEWVADDYRPYPGSTYRSPFFGKYKVVRGGSWNHPVADARTTVRDIAHPARRLGVVGFRCARTAP